MPAPWRTPTRRSVWLCLAGGAVLALVWFSPRLAARYELYRARRALDLFQADLAVQRLESARHFDPQNAQMHFLLGRALRRLERFDEMSRELEEAGRRGIPADRIQRELRLSVAQTARVGEVEAYLPQMLTAPGEDGREICAAFFQGFCLRLNFALANRVLDAWAADFPGDAEPHARRGDLYESTDDMRRAAAAYGECLVLDPSRTQVRLKLARCLLSTNAPDEAAPHLRICIKEAPDSPEAWFRMGECLFMLGQIDESRRALQRSVQCDPRHFGARQQLGELEIRDGNADEALRWIGPLYEDWPEDPRLATAMAQTLQKLGRADEAEKCWQAASRAQKAITRFDDLVAEVRANPEDVNVRYEFGMLLLRYKSREDGVVWLKSLLQFDPRHHGAHRALADYYSKIGESEQADRHRRLAEETGPS